MSTITERVDDLETRVRGIEVTSAKLDERLAERLKDGELDADEVAANYAVDADRFGLA